MKRVILFSFSLWLVLAFCSSVFAQNVTKLMKDGYKVSETPNQQVDGDYFSASNIQNDTPTPFNPEAATILRWDDGVNFNSIGLTSGGTFKVSARFDATIMTPLAGEELTQIEIYVAFYTPGTIILEVYTQDTPINPGALIYSEDVTGQIVVDSWNLITLATPVPIDGNDLWIGYEVTHPNAGEFPAGTDVGPMVPDGGWIYLDPGPWATIASFGLDYNWNIAGYVEPTGGAATLLWIDDFESGLVNWDVLLPQDPCDWGIYNVGTWPSLAPQLPPSASGDFLGASSDACGTVMNVYANGNFSLDLSLWTDVFVGFGSDFEVFGTPVPEDTARVDISVDGGVTWTEIFYRGPLDAPAEEIYLDVSTIAQFQSDVRFRLCYYGDFSWHWILDNFAVYGDRFIPVELTSFAASVNENDITLNWVTATETNNQGFEIERNSGNGFENIGYVAGFGTTSETHSYSFVDASLSEGTYTYRLKQVDLDGSFEYSDAIEVDVNVPDVFALEQNYPNPFNPSTKINFSLAVDSKVSLKVFDVLGQEVAALISSDLVAGTHNVDFNASSLNSGVYFYRIEATGIDGTNFTNVKKMILTK